MLYAYEGIPSALTDKEIAATLSAAKQDRSPAGLRDYAILTLLTAYGLRDGEIKRLRLDDIDWRADTLRVRHSKSSAVSLLPLTAPVGDAIIKYLQGGRPECDVSRSLCSFACALQTIEQTLRRGEPKNKGRWRQSGGEARRPCVSSRPRRQLAEGIRTEKGYRRSIGTSLDRSDNPLPQAGDGRSARNRTGDSRPGGEIMKSWVNPDNTVIDRYLELCRLRYPTSPTYYRQVLNSFRDIVVQSKCPASAVSRAALEVWLHDRTKCWARSTVLHRARIVNGFLDFLVREGMIVSNPIADLRDEYCIKTNKAVIRALLAPDPDQALENLRQPPPFGSVLGVFMRDHIAMMRNRGFKYKTQEAWFRRFDRFLQEHPELENEPPAVMLQHWAASRSSLNHAAECEKLTRILIKAMGRQDASIPPRRPDPRPQQQVVKHWRQPYIYSPDEIKRLLEIARSYPSPQAPLRPLAVYTMLVLAYCAGLRLGELSRLDIGDIDLDARAIVIRETKFFKSRILPLSDSVMATLRDYLDARRIAGAPQNADSGLFWHAKGEKRYTSAAIAWVFVDILRRAGLKTRQGQDRRAHTRSASLDGREPDFGMVQIRR